MYVIIGQGAAGSATALHLRKLDPQARITVITNESDYFYSRIDLPDIVAGKYSPEQATLRDSAAFSDQGIVCRMGETVELIHPGCKVVEFTSGEQIQYTKLLIATGSQPIFPPLRGVGLAGVHTLWTMYQAQRLAAQAAASKRAVVVGAGLIGLKTALALRNRGLEVTVIERLPRVMPRQLDDTASSLLATALQAKGVKLLLGQEVTGIDNISGQVSAVQLKTETIPCDLVVMAVGVKPNTQLAKAAGLTIKRGIAVDEYLQTSVPGIYAAGDVAEVVDSLTGESTVPAIWPAAVQQGEIAAANMLGGRTKYEGSLAMNSVEVAGVPLVSVGDIFGDVGDQVVAEQRGNNYRRLVLRGGLLRGALLLGDIRHAGVFTSLIERKRSVTPEQLLQKSSYPDLLAL